MKSTLLVTPIYQNIQYSVQSQTAKWQKIPKDHVVNYVNPRFRCIDQLNKTDKCLKLSIYSQSIFRKEKKWNQFSDVTRWFLIDMTFWFDLLIVQFYTSFHISPFSQRSWRIILDLDSDFLSCYWNIGNFVINNFGVTVCDHCTVGCFLSKNVIYITYITA